MRKFLRSWYLMPDFDPMNVDMGGGGRGLQPTETPSLNAHIAQAKARSLHSYPGTEGYDDDSAAHYEHPDHLHGDHYTETVEKGTFSKREIAAPESEEAEGMSLTMMVLIGLVVLAALYYFTVGPGGSGGNSKPGTQVTSRPAAPRPQVAAAAPPTSVV